MTGRTNLKTWVVMSVFLLGMGCTAASGRTIYVDNYGTGDFNTIQAAINDANNGDTIIVADGVYTGPGNRDIDFVGKAITVRSENGPGNCIIDCNATESDRHRGFVFWSGENANSAIIGFTITNGYAPLELFPPPLWMWFSVGGAIFCNRSSPTISNCTFSGNRAEEWGGGMYNEYSSPTITNCTFSSNQANYGGGISCSLVSVTLTNCILWGNRDNGGTDESAQIQGARSVVNYCCIQGLTGALGGIGNIGDDPCFADPSNSDYHLQSQAGRWDANEGRWTKDDVTSPCIDAGNPHSPIGGESFPNGGRINMGAYGGTARASKSYFGHPVCEKIIAGDINGDCKVNFKDFALIAFHWLRDENK